MSDLSSAPVRAGDVIDGRYCVRGMIGAGGMSVVVEATHLGLGDLRAIKILRPELSSSRAHVERFVQEGRLAARIAGEHVVRMYDSGVTQKGTPYLVMEHLSGLDLHTLLQSRGHLPAEEAMLYVAQACKGLSAAHAEGIVHRDLKPSNLFLTLGPRGAPCIKVIDFGIAEVQRAGRATGVRIGDLCGTLAYMAPEQALLVDSPHPTSDVWALGIVLYELTTGHTPFYATTAKELVTRIVEAAPIRPTMLRDDLPSGLEAVILQCLEKSAACRFMNAAELGDALKDLLERPRAQRRAKRCPPRCRVRGPITAPGRDAPVTRVEHHAEHTTDRVSNG